MSSLRLQGVSFSFSDAVELLTDVELHLDAGWTGLVGANGAGKTTLLRLLAGELVPASGVVRREPPEARVALCPQRVESLDPEVVAFAGSDERTARRLFGQLALDPTGLSRWPTLSPGERKRWQVGAALFAEPEVLLLDEPTNHLDAEAAAVLLAALRRFRGVGVVISHDRELLDALTTRTVRVRNGRAELWPGGYSEAKADWEAEARGQAEARARAKEHQRQLAQRLDRERRAQEASARQVHVGARAKGKHDSDSRTLSAKTRASWAETKHGRNVAVVRGELERAERELPAFEGERELGRSIFVAYQRAPSAILAALPDGRTFARDDRVWLSGPNGAGKTTLVRALLGGLRVPRERVHVVPQELEAAEAAAALTTLRGLSPELKGRVLSLVAALGVDPDRLLGSSSPSPGEARKLHIAQGLAQHAWAVVLDEPTNHLDLPSIERLEAALRAYPGALLLVTHDERFAEGCQVSERWQLTGRGRSP